MKYFRHTLAGLCPGRSLKSQCENLRLLSLPHEVLQEGDLYCRDMCCVCSLDTGFCHCFLFKGKMIKIKANLQKFSKDSIFSQASSLVT